MAEDLQDESQKTEEPTHRRLEEAVKKGQVPFSREVTSFLMLLAFTFIVVWLCPQLFVDTRAAMMRYIETPHLYSVEKGTVQKLMGSVLLDTAAIIAVPALIAVMAALLSGFIQNGVIFSWEPIQPKLEKISPMKGIKRIFSMRSLIEFIKGILKLIIVGCVGMIAIWPLLPRLGELPGYGITEMLAFLLALISRILIGVCIVMFLVAILDYLYQKYEYIKNLRMSRQELKDEHKQQEGDPMIKQKLRQIRMERARKRMMAAVPSADVVVTNPTHFAVALKYETQKMRAPKVLAKGKDKVALKIREIAKEHKVPIVENPPLARALFDNVGLDEEIPFEHYKAVAEVIGYVYRLKGKVPPQQRGMMSPGKAAPKQPLKEEKVD